MTLFRSSILLLLLALGIALPSRAAVGGTTGAAFLQLGTGARSASLGQANVAWADDVYGLYYNPAGIATVTRQEIGFAHNALFQDLNYNYIAYTLPFRQGGTLGVAIQYVDLGSVERREISFGGDPTGVLGNATASDLAFSVAYARTVTDFLDLGATIKVINETLDNTSAAAFAVDLGAKWRPPVPGLTVGVSLSNFGTSLKFVRDNEDLPLTIRAGVGYRPVGSRWGLVGDMYYVRNHDLEGGIGGEWWAWPEHIVLRAGANTTTDQGSGLSVGAGFRWNDIALDYAFVPYGDLGDQNTVALAYQFGPTVRAPLTGSRTARTQPSREPYYPPVRPVSTATVEQDASISAPPVISTPPVAARPTARVPITRVSVGLVTELGNGEVTALGRQITLGLIQRLRERGLIVDPQAGAFFLGSYTTLEDGQLAVYGRVRDHMTGRALRSVKAVGSPDNIPMLMDALARQFQGE